MLDQDDAALRQYLLVFMRTTLLGCKPFGTAGACLTHFSANTLHGFECSVADRCELLKVTPGAMNFMRGIRGE